jgi:hypothetical protein
MLPVGTAPARAGAHATVTGPAAARDLKVASA